MFPSGPNKHQSAVTCLQFCRGLVLSSSDDGTVKLWDLRTGAWLRDVVALQSRGSGPCFTFLFCYCLMTECCTVFHKARFLDPYFFAQLLLFRWPISSSYYLGAFILKTQPCPGPLRHTDVTLCELLFDKTNLIQEAHKLLLLSECF